MRQPHFGEEYDDEEIAGWKHAAETDHRSNAVWNHKFLLNRHKRTAEGLRHMKDIEGVFLRIEQQAGMVALRERQLDPQLRE